LANTPPTLIFPDGQHKDVDRTHSGRVSENGKGQR